MTLPEWALRHPVSTVMGMVSVVVLGAISLTLIPVEFFPDTDSPYLRVTIPYPSSAPDDIRRRITLPVEEVLSTLPNLTSISSSSSRSQASFSLRFEIKTDMDLMVVEVRDRLDMVRGRLPDDVEKMRIHRFRSTERPVIQAFISYDGPAEEMMVLAEDVVRPRMLRVPGVADVDLHGMRRKRFSVELDRERLGRHHIDVRQVADAIRQNHETLSGGMVRSSGQTRIVRIIGELESPEALEKLIIGDSGVRLRDVGTVSYAEPPLENINEMDGIRTLNISIQKGSTANLVSVARASRAALEQLSQELDGLTIHIFRDRSKSIMQRVDSLKQAALIGGALAVVFIFLFLRHIPSTLVVAVTIPLSAVATFGAMYLLRRFTGLNITINIISLMGLLIAVGMLVDPSVVVLENIFRQRHDHGLDPFESAKVGASRVRLALSAATLTSLCVFMPMIFLPTSRFGMWMRDFAVVISCALVSALLVSLTLVPLLSRWAMTGTAGSSSKFLEWLETGYSRLAALTVRRRLSAFLTVGVALGLLIGSWFLMQSIERQRMRYIPARRADVRMEFDNVFTLAKVDSVVHRIYDILDSRRTELEIETLVLRASRRNARVQVYLVDDGTERIATDQAKVRIKALMPVVPGLTYRMSRFSGAGGSESGVQVELRGRRMETLELLTQAAEDELRQLSGVAQVDNSLEAGMIELTLRVKEQQGSQKVATPRQVSSTLSMALSDRAVAQMTLEEREVDISMRVEGGREALTPHSVRSLPVRSADESTVPLESMVLFGYQEGPQPISRQDRKSTITVSVDGKPGVSNATLTAAVERAMNSIPYPPGYEWRFNQNQREFRQNQAVEWNSIALAVILVYMVMAALFESFVYPLVILSAIPFALTGVALTLYVTQQPLDNMTMIGLVILAGLVVNNAIVLIDYVNQLRATGMGRLDAIVTGGKHRLRPILMTALTTIFGLLPMASSLIWSTFVRGGDWIFDIWGSQLPDMIRYLIPPDEGGARFWAPMGLVLIGGLAMSTMLTLVLIPAIYVVLDDISVFATRTLSQILRKKDASASTKPSHLTLP